MLANLLIIYGGMVVVLLAHWAGNPEDFRGENPYGLLARILLWPIMVPAVLILVIIALVCLPFIGRGVRD